MSLLKSAVQIKGAMQLHWFLCMLLAKLRRQLALAKDTGFVKRNHSTSPTVVGGAGVSSRKKEANQVTSIVKTCQTSYTS